MAEVIGVDVNLLGEPIGQERIVINPPTAMANIPLPEAILNAVISEGSAPCTPATPFVLDVLINAGRVTDAWTTHGSVDPAIERSGVLPAESILILQS